MQDRKSKIKSLHDAHFKPFGWGFVPIGNSRGFRENTHSNHYFYNSNKSLCGLLTLSRTDLMQYKFTEGKNIMSFLRCHTCLNVIHRINKTNRQLKKRGIQ